MCVIWNLWWFSKPSPMAKSHCKETPVLTLRSVFQRSCSLTLPLTRIAYWLFPIFIHTHMWTFTYLCKYLKKYINACVKINVKVVYVSIHFSYSFPVENYFIQMIWPLSLTMVSRKLSQSMPCHKSHASIRFCLAEGNNT